MFHTEFFTQYIENDFSTFLTVYLATHPTANNNHKIKMFLERTAKRVFGANFEKSFVQNNGLFDKILIDCSFNDQFMKVGKPLKANCDLFQHALTSNGLCQSFNTETPSKIWHDNFISAKDIEDLVELKPRNIKNFVGAGSNEGLFI